MVNGRFFCEFPLIYNNLVFAIFDGVHNGVANFNVYLQDEFGNNLELLVNEISSYNGKTFPMTPNSGNYYLNIKAVTGNPLYRNTFL